MSIIVQTLYEVQSTKALLLTVIVLAGAILHRLLVPPKVNDGGVKHISALKTLYWTFKSSPSRLDLCNKVDIPALQETGIVRSWLWGRWMYKINNADYARQLYLKTSVYQKIELHNLIPYVFRAVAAGGNLMTENGDRFKAHRSIVGASFRRTWPASTFRTHLGKLENMIRRNGRGLDVLNACRRATLDVLGQIIMGTDFGGLDNVDGELLEICWDVVDAGIEPLYLVFPILDKYPVGKRARSFANLKKFHAFIEQTIAIKRAELAASEKLGDIERNNADLLTLMIEAHEQTKIHGAFDENGKQLPTMTSEELRNNTIIFFVAGHDATAYSLSHLIAELARHPDKQQQARELVIGVLGDTSDAYPTDEQLNKLAGLDMFIKESMRKNSTVSDVRRQLTEPVSLGPYTLPKGAWVMVDLWALQNNPIYYPNPDKYIPERFQEPFSKDDGADLTANANVPFTWTPFSEGSRKCIGHKFAMLTQRIVLALLVHRFTWTLPDDSPFATKPLTTTSGLISPIDLKVNFVPRHAR
ncbi:cytochrome P450 [Coemansia reversa NRRL 1564]|uniref:Cytochrome P450 n=1 Tax=Coemansia reversa (strain ATCC 12441 / NRRL 1564) TaxID=763665 RepID=A0A2G5BCA9_COERN|nr:cytochrome P450 [Coemansia reversa NRRL 1564]|eukprot:PIA16632.1 cytochrome P450 [Coemansia reversa NRRL 1564]